MGEITLYIICVICMCESAVCIDDISYSYQFDSGYGNREELVIKKVKGVDNFKIDEPVTKWRSLSLKHKSYALGLTENGVTVVQAVVDGTNNDTFVTNSSHTPMNGTILDAHLFEYRKPELIGSDIIAVIAIGKNKTKDNSVDLKWFKVVDNNKLVNIWKWDLYKNITHINVFKIDDRYHILVCNERLGNNTSADLYEFTLGSVPNFWLNQKIELETSARSSAISYFGADMYMSIPQENAVRIFKLDRSHFISYKNLSTSNANYITSFKIGFQAYLAVDGYNAGIYKFEKDGFSKEDIVVLDGIDYWLSIPIRSYRDEQILIAERSLDYTSHQSFVIEVVLYNGGKFMVHDEMTCDYYGEISNGMNCLVEEESTRGVKGSAVLAIGDTLGVIIPGYRGSSRLIMIHKEMKQIESPLEKQMKAFQNLKDKLQIKIDSRKKILSVGSKLTKKLVIENQGSILSAPLEARRETESVLKEFNDFDWTDGGNKLTELADRLKEIRNALNDLSDNLRNYVPIRPGEMGLKNVIISGSLEVHGDSNIQNIVTADFNNGVNFSDIVRLDNMQPIPSHKTFHDINVKFLTFNEVNDINSRNLINKNMNTLNIRGDITFTDTVTVTGNVDSKMINGIILENEIIQTGKSYDDTIDIEHIHSNGILSVQKANKFPIHENVLNSVGRNEKLDGIETKEFDSLFIPGNITAINVNGNNLDSIISSLCMTNIDTYVPSETHILGDVTITHELSIAELNNLKYPEEYVLSKSDKFSKITGDKIFTNHIEVKELSTTGTVNTVDANDVVTLSKNQSLTGNFTFQTLTVTESFNVTGNVTHNHTHDVLPNPTLSETNVVSSNINFNTLEVDGEITVGANFNGTNLFNILADVVYKNNDVEVISAIKGFSNGLTIRKNLILESNAINSVSLESFIHKETQQVMAAQTLNGDVSFENIQLLGSFGSINISKLEQETVKLSGNQFISSQLIFEDDVIANDLDIVDTLNDIKSSDYLYTDGNRLMKTVNFDKIETRHLEIRGSLFSHLKNFNLSEFDNRRLSYTKEQQISADFYVEKSNIQYLKPMLINNYTFNNLFNLNYYAEKVRDMITDGQVKIKKLHVEDSINITRINGIPMEHILQNCMWTQDNNRKKDITISGNVNFRAVEIDFFNDMNITELRRNIIFKNETDNVPIFGPKIYMNGYEVANYISAPLINGIPVDNVLRKAGEQTISSPLVIEGDVLINSDCTVTENIGEVPIEYYMESFSAIDENNYKINGDVAFSRLAYIDHLQLNDCANNQHMDTLLNSLVNVNEDAVIAGVTTFKSNVDIENNLAINSTINGIDISNIKENVVFITQDAIVEGVVSFKENVIITEGLTVDIGLQCPSIMGVQLQDWIDNSVFLNRGKIPGTITFEQATVGTQLITSMLNSIALDTLIPLRSEQTIEELHFTELSSFNDIVINNHVNGYKLVPEVLNSVLSDRIQEIVSVVTFNGNVLVRRLLDINGLLNGHDARKIVTTDTKQELHATYEFLNRTSITGSMNIYGLINGLNITEWINSGMKKFSKQKQTIRNPWTVNKNVVFEKNVLSTGSINGLDLRTVANQVEDRRVFKYTVELKLLEQFQNICKDINGIVAISKKQIYLFDYLDYYQHKTFSSNIETLHQFQYQGVNYLLISEDNNCMSSLFAWSRDTFNLVKEIEMGRISQMITVYDGDFLFIVSKGDNVRSSCNYEGINIWKFSVDNLMLLYKIENYDLLKDSLVPGTFYAMASNEVVEYRIISTLETNIYKVRKWSVITENATFMPRGYNTGLALRNGINLIELSRDDPITLDYLGQDYSSITLGNVTWSSNHYLPGRFGAEILMMHVGYPRRKILTAVATHEETSIKGKLNLIKIYGDPVAGTMFDKVPCYKPSSLLSLEIGENGETLLMFLENQKILQIYEYKGIEGFQHRTTVNMAGSKLVQFTLPFGDFQKSHNFVGVIYKNRLTLLQTIMEGDQMLDDNMECTL